MKIVLDLEIYPNFFMLGLKDYVTGDTSYFEVSDYKDDRRKLYQWLCTYRGYVISFNGISYDNMVLAFIKKEWSILCNHPDFCLEVKNFSDKVIDSESNFEYLKPYRYTFQKQWVDVDLYLYWSKNLRLTKKVSLKGLGIQMGYPVVQELPYPPHQHLTREQIEEVKNYNLQHDLGITRLLAKQFTGQGHVSIGNLGTIQLRQFITKTYGINAMSMDGPKIASEILLQNYCKTINKNPQEVRDLRFPSETIYFGEILKDIPVNFKNPTLQKVHQEWLKAVGSFSKEFVLLGNHPIKISVGQGGIHSINKNEIYVADDNHLIITDDIGAMYPTNIENWKAFRFPEIQQTYVEFKEKRIKETKPGMKQHPKGSPEWNEFYQKDSFYKLILNGEINLHGSVLVCVF